MFTFNTWRPAQSLEKFVKRICFYEGSFSQVSRYRQPVLPYVTPTLEFLYGDRFHTVHIADGKSSPVPDAGVLGPITAYQIDLDFVGEIKNMAVEFWPHAFTALFRVPMQELTDQAVSAADIFGSSSYRLVYDIRQAKTNGQRKEYLEKFLTDHLAKTPPVDDVRLSQALHQMHAQQGVRVGQIARDLNVSERYLEKRFQSVIGVSPKKYMQILRFNRMISMLKKGKDMMDMVVDLGYHDQAHMIREFKGFAGCSPSRYRSSLEFESFFLGSQQSLTYCQ